MDESDSNVPEGEKRLIRAVLFSEWGVPLDRFQKYYQELEGKPFPFKKLGFSSLEECLKSIPDVVRFEYSQEASKWILYAVADDKSFMSSFTRKKQLSNTKAGLPQKGRNRRGRSSGRRNGNGPKESDAAEGDIESKLLLSSRGYYSIIVRSRDHCLDKEEIEDLLKETAPIAESSCFQRLKGVFLFFRYEKKEDAVAVIKKFNNYNHRGYILTVKPAEEKMPVTRGEPVKNNQSSPRTSEGGSSSSSGGMLPPPLLEDDDYGEDDWDDEEEGEEEFDDDVGHGSSFQESGPPPLESDSDSGEWSDEDVSNKQTLVTNGYHPTNSHKSLGAVKVFSPGRGRGLSQFR